MAQKKREPQPDRPPYPPPATTPEGREEQLTMYAYDLVERRMWEGTASAQETVHFLKQGSTMNQLIVNKLRSENEVLQARVKELESKRGDSELTRLALNAFRGYSGQDEDDDEEEPYDPDVY